MASKNLTLYVSPHDEKTVIMLTPDREPMARDYDYDVVIVGGGPAGLSAGWAAARNGARVAVLEREEAIGQSVRTSGVTWIREARSFGIPPEN